MEGQITFKYSTDGGSTWSTATALDAKRAHAWLRPEGDGDQAETMGSDRICWKAVPRLVLSLEMAMPQFDPTKTASGDSNWVFINKLRCAPLIHIHHNGVASDIDGFTEWAATANTNYLVPDDVPDAEYIATDGTRLRAMAFTLVLRDGYDIGP